MLTSREITQQLEGIGLKRAPAGVPIARNGIMSLLGAHDQNLADMSETTFRLSNDLRRKLRDSGMVVERHSDGHTYLYVHGLALHRSSPVESAEERLKTKISRFKDYLFSNGLAREPDDVRFHLKGYGLKNSQSLSESIGAKSVGLIKAIRKKAGPQKAMHSVVVRIRLKPEHQEIVTDAFADWKASNLLTRSSGKGGTNVLMARAYTPKGMTATARIPKRKGPKPYRRDTPGQRLFEFYKTDRK